jgi:hypothetical protein
MIVFLTDLSRRDERVVAKILATLVKGEPGGDTGNWAEQFYRLGYDGLPMTGWELPNTWLSEEGMPRTGFLYVNYYAGEGDMLEGHGATVPLRMALLNMV